MGVLVREDATGMGYTATNATSGGTTRVITTDLGAAAYAGLKVGSTGGGGAHNNMPPEEPEPDAQEA